MTSIQHIPPRLEAIRPHSDSMICCFQFEDTKPLKGISGLLDWRLLGQLSKLRMSGVFSGKRSESLLVLPGNRLQVNYLVLIGGGHPESLSSDDFRDMLSDMIETARRLRVSHISVSLPGRDEGIISGETSIQWFFQHFPSQLNTDTEFSFAIIDTSETHAFIAAESDRHRLRIDISRSADSKLEINS